MSVIAVCSLKGGGSSTLALTIASAAAAAGRRVSVIDASRNADILRWSAMPRRPDAICVKASRTALDMERLIREGLKNKGLVVVDAGIKRERIRLASRLADTTLIPVRFSPLSAYWAAETDRMLRADDAFGRPRRRVFVATAIAQIPSRIARTVEAEIEPSPTARLPVGLALRAAFEAPFLFGGTVFTLPAEAAPGLPKAQDDAMALAVELGLPGVSRFRAERMAATAETAERRAVRREEPRPLAAARERDRTGRLDPVFTLGRLDWLPSLSQTDATL